jgi:outer membrane protein assembly factor BamB/ankyrin repeat protein
MEKMRRNFVAWFIIVLLPLVVSARDLNEDLWAAARKGDAQAVKALLAKGAEVNAKTRYGATALSYAADRGYLEVVKILVEHGADVNVKDTFYGAPALTWAAYNGHAEVVKFLLEKGAEGKDSALMIGIQSNDVEMVNAVLAVGGLSAETLSSALTSATQSGKTEIAEALKNAGATPPAAASDFKIDSALLQACVGRYKNDEIGMEMTIAAENGKLIGSITGQPSLTYAPIDNTNFKAVEFGGITITFNQTGDFTLKQGGRSFVFKKVKAEEKIAEIKSAESEKKETKAETAMVTAASKAKKHGIAMSWPSFRGMLAAGVADGQNPPTTWSAEKAQNIKWKTPIPGMAHASPVIWGNRVFITTSISSDTSSKLRVGLYGDVAPDKDLSKHTWKVYVLDKKSGKIIWERTAYEGIPKVKRHTKATQANSTPATDGKHLVVLFGAEGLYCYDLDGKLLWKKDVGVLDGGWFYDPDYQWGHGSSPIIYKNLVIVQCDIQKNSFIAAYDLKDGKQVWLTPRDEIPSWGTPTIHEGKGRVELITNGTKYIRGYDPLTGKELWKLGGNSEITTPTPFVAHDLIFVTSGYRPIQPIYAIRTGASGDISLKENEESNAHIAWSKKRGGPYMPTPIVYGDYLYTCANNGTLTCYNAKTGEQIYRERLGGKGSGYAFTASPIAADDKLYFTSEDGEIYVVKAGPQYELIATNSMGEVCMATPAISEGMIFVRTQGHVYGIGE